MKSIKTPRRAFTLVEMLVVLAIMALATAAAIPTINRAMESSARTQSYNLMGALIKGARTTAIRTGRHAAVHHQPVDTSSEKNRRKQNQAIAAILSEAGQEDLVLAIQVDEVQASQSGSWGSSTSATAYGGTYLTDGGTGESGKSVTFTPNLDETSEYDVYMWWPNDVSGAATNVPVEVRSADGSTTVIINMNSLGNGWFWLGRWNFAAGTGGQVIVRNDGADGEVIADAVQFRRVLGMRIFALAEGQRPMNMPSSMAAGALNGRSVNTSTNDFQPNGVGGTGDKAQDQEAMEDFTTFNVIFGTTGSLVTRVGGEDVAFSMFSQLFDGENRIWSYDLATRDDDQNGQPGEGGTEAITTFDFGRFRTTQAEARVKYLNDTAQLLPINVQTGLLQETR